MSLLRLVWSLELRLGLVTSSGLGLRVRVVQVLAAAVTSLFLAAIVIFDAAAKASLDNK